MKLSHEPTLSSSVICFWLATKDSSCPILWVTPGPDPKTMDFRVPMSGRISLYYGEISPANPPFFYLARNYSIEDLSINHIYHARHSLLGEKGE